MKQNILTSTLLVMGLLVGCTQAGSTEDKLLGSWNFSVFMSPSKVAEMSKDPLPPGATMEITMEGSTTILHGHRYNAEGQATLRLAMQGKELPLKFLIRESGRWEMHDDVFVQITEDGVVTPLDDMTRSIVADSPEMTALFEPVKGASASSRILNISHNEMNVVTLEEPKGLRVKYIRTS